MKLPPDLATVIEAIPKFYLGEYYRQRLPKMVEIVNALPPDTLKILMRTSINGRIALGITCFENYCTAVNFHEPCLAPVLDKLWQFVESNALDVWDEEICRLCQSVIQAVKTGQDPFDPQWAQLSRVGCQMLYQVIEIGGGNLYAGTLGYSLDTLWPTLLVLEQTLIAGIPLPNLTPFQRSSFAQFHGWGDRVPRSFFKCPGA